MEVPNWTSVIDPINEAYNKEELRQHMLQYNERLSKQKSVSPQEISILWIAYRMAGDTLKSAPVLNNLLKICKTDHELGLLLIKSQCNSGTYNLKPGYELVVIAEALSLINSLDDLEPCIIKVLKNDGWFYYSEDNKIIY
ncbi:hypothetical protein PIROE2DRAFT_12319 [Piromyces sp. E2]|nr:hypothetical protein PIROE2DRAFT_12319 [Piromyces sp. E2]|eukprot:OUM61625.1 hypothetical protein PIROE2DRAFT_12319 [Piromyces sp. E2]